MSNGEGSHCDPENLVNARGMSFAVCKIGSLGSCYLFWHLKASQCCLSPHVKQNTVPPVNSHKKEIEFLRGNVAGNGEDLV